MEAQEKETSEQSQVHEARNHRARQDHLRPLSSHSTLTPKTKRPQSREYRGQQEIQRITAQRPGHQPALTTEEAAELAGHIGPGDAIDSQALPWEEPHRPQGGHWGLVLVLHLPRLRQQSLAGVGPVGRLRYLCTPVRSREVRVATGGRLHGGQRLIWPGHGVCSTQLSRILSRQAGHAGSQQQQQLPLVP